MDERRRCRALEVDIACPVVLDQECPVRRDHVEHGLSTFVRKDGAGRVAVSRLAIEDTRARARERRRQMLRAYTLRVHRHRHKAQTRGARGSHGADVGRRLDEDRRSRCREGAKDCCDRRLTSRANDDVVRLHAAADFAREPASQRLVSLDRYSVPDAGAPRRPCHGLDELRQRLEIAR